MYRGTTPTFTFKLPFAAANVTKLSILFRQAGGAELEKALNEQKYSAGYFAASILNISVEELVDLMEAAGVILKHQPEIVLRDRWKILDLLPALKAEVPHLVFM